jgi:hypothetical protein
MSSISLTEIRREIIHCANHREAFAVCKFLVDYLDIRGLTDRLEICLAAPSKGSQSWRVDLIWYEPLDALTFLAPAAI